MCGIAGIVGGWPDARATVERMLSSLRHRGPDGAAVHHVRGAVLGHQRLSIIDLEGGRQPIGNEDGTKWIVCNGEIYNYRELTRGTPGPRPPIRAPDRDTEVMLHLYERVWRSVPRAPARHVRVRHLGRSRRTLCSGARSPRPEAAVLHAAWRQAAHSPPRSRRCSRCCRAPPPTDLDASAPVPVAARHRAAAHDVPRGSRKLPPGHCLAYSPRQGMRIRRYWDLDYEPKHGGSERELLEELERQLIEAVRLHMVSDVPVGRLPERRPRFDAGGGAGSRPMRREGPMPTFTMGLAYGEYRRGSGRPLGRANGTAPTTTRKLSSRR